MNALANWYKDNGNAAELAVLLKNPVLKQALEIVENSNRPVFRPGVPLNDLATLHSFQAGVHHVARTLHFLTQPPAELADPGPEWEGTHVVPAVSNAQEDTH